MILPDSWVRIRDKSVNGGSNARICLAKTADMTVSIERLERALAIAAYCVVLDGPVAAPLYERLERELAAVRAANDSVSRARALLEDYLRDCNGLGRRSHIGYPL